MQSKYHSFLESLTNILIGYIVAIASQLLIFPLFDIYIPLSDNLLIGAWFTVISIIRSYVLRRWFNKRTLFQYKAASRDLLIDAEDVPEFLKRQAD